MDCTIISELALKFLLDGVEAKREGDLENARVYFSFARAFNHLQEYDAGIRLCEELMLKSGVNECDLPFWREYGSSKINYALGIVTQINSTLHPERIDRGSSSIERAVDALFE